MLIDEFVTDETIMVEIGSFAGVSSELFALHCKNITCVDEWNPYWEIQTPELIIGAENMFDKKPFMDYIFSSELTFDKMPTNKKS